MVSPLWAHSMGENPYDAMQTSDGCIRSCLLAAKLIIVDKIKLDLIILNVIDKMSYIFDQTCDCLKIRRLDLAATVSVREFAPSHERRRDGKHDSVARNPGRNGPQASGPFVVAV